MAEQLLGLYTRAPTPASSALHSRAGGMVAELRKLPNGTKAVRASIDDNDPTILARFMDALVLRDCPPELLHHMALFHAKGAAALERSEPDIAATAWVRSLAAWIALAEERTYLAKLEEAILKGAQKNGAGANHRVRTPDRAIPPERVPLEVMADIAHRANAAARELGAQGRASLIALARADEALKLADASPQMAQDVRSSAERLRNKAIESALAVISEGLDEASVRGELATSGRVLLLRAVPVWTWTGNDEAVEQFVVERVDKIGWELYRARHWDALRYLLDPFRPMFDSLASRIERDPSRIAYAAGCAQMFVFMAEVDRNLTSKLETAERAVKICEASRNGRLVLASALCDSAISAMRQMVVFARRDELSRVEKMIERAEALYPTTSELPEAKNLLERVKKGRITV